MVSHSTASSFKKLDLTTIPRNYNRGKVEVKGLEN